MFKVKAHYFFIFLSFLIFTSCNDNNYVVSPTPLSNSPYIEVYNTTENGYTLTINDLNTWYNFTNLAEGENYGFNFSSNGIEALYEGVYKLDYSISFSGSGGSTYAVSLLINGVEHDPCRIYRKLGTAGDVGNAGGTCLLTINENDIITGVVKDVNAPAQDMNIWSFNANFVKVGGII